MVLITATVVTAAVAATAPVTAEVAAVTKPVAPADQHKANVEPAATAPILDYQAAAIDPAATPAAVNPANHKAGIITNGVTTAAPVTISIFF